MKPTLTYTLKTKTVEDWFKSIRDPEIRKEALENMMEGQRDKMVSSVEDALNIGFRWHKTPQYDKYWRDIKNKFRTGQLKVNRF